MIVLVVGFTTTYVISTYHNYSCEFEFHSYRGLFDATLSVFQWLAVGRWFSPGSSPNRNDHHDITELLLQVAINNNSHAYANKWKNITHV